MYSNLRVLRENFVFAEPAFHYILLRIRVHAKKFLIFILSILRPKNDLYGPIPIPALSIVPLGNEHHNIPFAFLLALRSVLQAPLPPFSQVSLSPHSSPLQCFVRSLSTTRREHKHDVQMSAVRIKATKPVSALKAVKKWTKTASGLGWTTTASRRFWLCFSW